MRTRRKIHLRSVSRHPQGQSAKPQGLSSRACSAIGYDEKEYYFSDMGFCCGELDVPVSRRSFKSECAWSNRFSINLKEKNKPDERNIRQLLEVKSEHLSVNRPVSCRTNTTSRRPINACISRHFNIGYHIAGGAVSLRKTLGT